MALIINIKQNSDIVCTIIWKQFSWHICSIRGLGKNCDEFFLRVKFPQNFPNVPIRLKFPQKSAFWGNFPRVGHPGFGCHSWPPFGIWRRKIESDRNDFNTRNFFIFNLKYSNYINNIFFLFNYIHIRLHSTYFTPLFLFKQGTIFRKNFLRQCSAFAH